MKINKKERQAIVDFVYGITKPGLVVTEYHWKEGLEILTILKEIPKR